jgi:hypothetical protein
VPTPDLSQPHIRNDGDSDISVSSFHQQQKTLFLLLLSILYSMGSTSTDETATTTTANKKTQPHLKPQDAKTVDASQLTALSPEVVCLEK